MENKKNNEFIAQGSILAAASILVRIIGMVYRIPMTSIIGDEGNGLYSYAYGIYTILLLLSSYSLPLAVSKMVSAKAEVRQWRNVERIFQCALLFGLLVGTFFAVCVLFGAKLFTTTVYKSGLAAIALRFMAPTILIMAILGVFRGFFQGLQTTKPTAFSQLLEQIVNAVVSVLGAWLLFGYGAKMDKSLGMDGLDAAWGAAGGAIGTGVGALAALIFCLILFLRFIPSLRSYTAQDQTGTQEDYSNIFRVLVAIAVPVILSTAIYNLIDMIDGSLFSYYMLTAKEGGETTNTWGAYTGKCLLMIHIPVSIASAMAVSLVPSLTAAHSQKKKRTVNKRITAILKFTSTVAFPSAVGLFILADPIIKTLFPGDTSQAASYLAAEAVAVIVFSWSTITNSILQGVDRMTVPVTHSIISLIVHLAVCAVLLWGLHLGIYGIIIGYILFGLCMTIFNFRSMYRYLGYLPNLIQTLLLPLLCSAVMGVICFGVYRLFGLFAGRIISLLVAVIVSIAVYFVMIIRTKLMTQRDLCDLPMGVKVAAFAKRVKLL